MRKTILFIAVLSICVIPLSAGIYPDYFNDSNHNEYDINGYINYIAPGAYTSALFNNTAGPDATGLTGEYDVTAFAFEAGYDNQLAITFNNLVLFNNYDPMGTGSSLAFGTWVNIPDIAALFFNDNHGFTQALVNSNVNMYTLTSAITVPASGLALEAGTIIIGWNDSANDSDHDDMIIALRPGGSYETVPEPGLLLLLCGSLIGLAALKRII